MKFNDYQVEAYSFVVYPEAASTLYPALGLAEEAGEVAGKVAKALRGDYDRTSEEWIESVVKELGDVLWMIAALATALNVPLENVARKNIEKLQARRQRNEIKNPTLNERE